VIVTPLTRTVVAKLRYTFSMILKFLRRLAIATALIGFSGVFLIGCATSKEPVRVGAGNAEQLYNAAKKALNQGDFLTAISTFETLGARYPFGNYTQQAQLDVAYAYLKQDEFDSAINAADRFIKLYPRSENIDYAYYIKGVSHFSRGGSAMERIFPRDMAKVNQKWLSSSFADFDTLVRRFPNSVYTPDALERMSFLKNEMAEHELITAQFYFQRGAMVAVVNRVNYLLEHFDGSNHIPDALALLANAYKSLGQEDRQSDTLRVLRATDPDHAELSKS